MEGGFRGRRAATHIIFRTYQGSTHSRACCGCCQYRATYLTAEASRRLPRASPSIKTRSSPQQFNYGEVDKRWCRLLLAIFGHEQQSQQPRSLEMYLVRWIEATTAYFLFGSAHEPSHQIPMHETHTTTTRRWIRFLRHLAKLPLKNLATDREMGIPPEVADHTR